jgi:hypothetical protein
MGPYDANTLALLGGLPGTDGLALHQAALAVAPGQAFDLFRQAALTGGQRVVGSTLTVEEAFARLAAMGYAPSVPPVAYHCLEDGCHARAQLMIDRLLQLGVGQAQIRKAWAFSERAVTRAGLKMRPTKEDGSLLLDYAGVVLEFDYHVAPAILVEAPGGGTGWRVLDPALLSGPADVDLWHQRVGIPAQVPLSAQLTELGIPPVHPGTGMPFPGSGYRPGLDPQLQSTSRHAAAVMREIMRANGRLGRPARPLPQL